jgi:hypothetical protein
MSKFDSLVGRRRAEPAADPQTHAEKVAAGWRRFNVLLPPEEHLRFKFACLEDEVEMSEKVREFIQSWLAQR